MEKFDPGQAPVYPLPERDPMRTLADWGAPPDPPIQPDYPGAYERPWLSPGRPPWAESKPPAPTGWIELEGQTRPRRRAPGWAVACVLVGSLLAIGAAAFLAFA
jgi:hypothetical protein